MELFHKVENATYDVVTISSKMYDFMVQWCDVVITVVSTIAVPQAMLISPVHSLDN